MALLKPQLMSHITVFLQLQEKAALNKEHQLEEVQRCSVFCFVVVYFLQYTSKMLIFLYISVTN